MQDRIEDELALLKKYYLGLQVSEDKSWVLIPEYDICKGLAWNKQSCGVCFQIPVGYPGAAPYGIYVPSDLQFDGGPPESFQQNAQNKPPFSGDWGFLSWTQDEWFPDSNIIKGSNLLNFVKSFSD